MAQVPYAFAAFATEQTLAKSQARSRRKVCQGLRPRGAAFPGAAAAAPAAPPWAATAATTAATKARGKRSGLADPGGSVVHGTKVAVLWVSWEVWARE